jgi:pimeloyl-ACP methyl ester carboxylesterase
MGETMVPANGVDLCLETFGVVTDAPVLLIAGGASSMDWWEDDFCRRLAAGGRFVIRYDHRDTGRSTSFPPGRPPYTQVDMAEDALGVLNALGLASAHVVGLSLGGGLAQRLAVEDAPRLRTVTLMSTSPGLVDEPPTAPKRPCEEWSRTEPAGTARRSPSGGPGGTARESVESAGTAWASPTAAAAGTARESSRGETAGTAAPRLQCLDWSDRETAVERLVACVAAIGGPFTADAAHLRTLAVRMLERTADPASCANHWLAGDGPPVRDRLGTVGLPTLILHGTVDPLYSMAHPAALAREIPAARMVPLPGVGHEFPPRAVWDVVVAEILRHTA